MAQGNGTGGSRVSSVGASAAHAASEKIIEKAKAVAGHELEAAAADIEFADGAFEIAGTDRRLSWRDVAAAAHQEGLPETLQGGLSSMGTFKAPQIISRAEPMYARWKLTRKQDKWQSYATSLLPTLAK